MRVISVLPSATEIVCALGHRSELVGRSSECDFPVVVQALPVVMRPRTLDSDRPAREIDARVREARAREESLYQLDLELLRNLRPDLLLTQDLCGVCSVTQEEVVSACEIAGVHPRVLSLSPTTLSEVWETVPVIGHALGDGPRGSELAASLRARTEPRQPTGRSVAVLEWLDPPILAGLWTPDLILAAGGEPVGPRSSERGERTTWDAIARAAPDLVVVSPCSFSVPRTFRELENRSLLAHLLGVRPRLGTFVADEAYFSRPGPRLAAGAELIATLLEGGTPYGPMPVAPISATLVGATP